MGEKEKKENKVIGRYTLTTGPLHVEGYVKARLREIDLYTTRFKNEAELREDAGLFGTYRITYKHNNEMKERPIAYSDKKLLAELTFFEDKNISLTNGVFIEQVTLFLNKVELDENFHKFVRNCKLLSDILKNAIYDYVNAKRSADPFSYDDVRNYETRERRVYELLSDYVQFRNILFLIGEYDGHVAELEAARLQKEAEELHNADSDEHQEEFFTQADYSEHKEYILSHNIPVPDAMKDRLK